MTPKTINSGINDAAILNSQDLMATRLLGKYRALDSGCWQWSGATNGKLVPYGRLNIAGLLGGAATFARAHRVSWLVHKGAIPDGLHVLHKCDNTLCINPDHLFLGTHEQNMADREQKGRNNPISGDAWRTAHAGTLPTGANHFLARNPERVMRGSQLSWAKLDECRVLEIRRILNGATKGEPVFDMAKKYGVSHHTIRLIAKRKVWTHV